MIAIGLASAMLTGAQGPPKFEVASIRLSQPEERRGDARAAPGGERFVATHASLRLLISVAYRVKADQISGGAGWMDSDAYELNAKAERPSSGEDLRLMLQALLAERFRLQFHREAKELPVYTLMVDRNGPKLQAHEGSGGLPVVEESRDRIVKVKIKATAAPMDYFAWTLSQGLDRPVVDQTGIQGGYDFELSYTRELPPGIREGALLNGTPIDTSGPTIFAAVRQQLGLRLEPQRGPVQILVIDHAEKPAAN